MTWFELELRVAKRHQDHPYVCQIELSERDTDVAPQIIQLDAFRIEMPGVVPAALHAVWVKTMLGHAAAEWELNRAIRAFPIEQRGVIYPPLFGDAVV